MIDYPIDYVILPKKQDAKRHHRVHPFFTKRPYNVVQTYINYFTKPGDIVLDPFCGSGTTGVACVEEEKTGFIGIDNNSDNVEMADKRIFKASQQMKLL